METNDNQHKEFEPKLTPDEQKAWYKLWQLATHSISVVDGAIDWQAFINDGFALFELKERQEL